MEVESPSGNVIVEKKKTATFDTDDKSTVAGNIVEAPFDSWDKEAISYHDQYAKNNSSPYGYGVADLNYYGSYSNVPGYGMMWQPYFTGVGWDPFMDGAWALVPRHGLYVRFSLSLGMDALSLRELELHPRFWLDVAARRMELLAVYAALHAYHVDSRDPAGSSRDWNDQDHRGWQRRPDFGLSVVRADGTGRLGWLGNSPRCGQQFEPPESRGRQDRVRHSAV